MEIEYKDGKDPRDLFYPYINKAKKYYDIIDAELLPNAPLEAVKAFEEVKADIIHARKMGIDC